MSRWLVRLYRGAVVGAVVLTLCAGGVLLRRGLAKDYSLAAFIATESEAYDTFRRLMDEFVSNEFALIVVAGQLTWFKGIATTSASQVSLANSFTPVAGVIFAVLLLGENPDMAVLAGGAIILFGIAVAQLGPIVGRRGTGRHSTGRHGTDRRALTSSEAVKLEGGVNFKGI